MPFISLDFSVRIVSALSGLLLFRAVEDPTADTDAF